MQTGTNQDASAPYPCPDCQETVQLGSCCGSCTVEFYKDNVELAADLADAEFRAMFPELSEAELADIERVADAACPESTDALDRSWL